MSRRRRILLITIAIATILVLATVHFTSNGFPSLGSLNPHSRWRSGDAGPDHRAGGQAAGQPPVVRRSPAGSTSSAS